MPSREEQTEEAEGGERGRETGRMGERERERETGAP